MLHMIASLQDEDIGTIPAKQRALEATVNDAQAKLDLLKQLQPLWLRYANFAACAWCFWDITTMLVFSKIALPLVCPYLEGPSQSECSDLSPREPSFKQGCPYLECSHIKSPMNTMLRKPLSLAFIADQKP